MENKHLGTFVTGITLTLICVLSFSIRLFSVVKYESVIHEFDPYFNYRVSQFLTKEGFYKLWNWFDTRTWYPLGRIIGGTLYPGLVFTAGSMYNVLHALNIPLNVQEVCVFTAPLFSAFCSLATYGFAREIRGNGAGLVSAALISTVPSYISRSVAGSFDNEGVAIFALVFTFYLFVKTLNTGSLSWATATAMAYLYMVMSWGGYSFIINLLPIHCLVSIFSGKLTVRLYVAYAPLVVMGTIAAASIPVVGFNAICMSEHFGAFFAFAVLHAALLINWIKSILPEKSYHIARSALIFICGVISIIVLILITGYIMTSPTYGWTGRSLTLLDPTYASKYIPIVASVSEHQPPTWASYFTDIHICVLLLPAGFIACFFPLSDASLFLLLYGLTSVYFSGVMVRLMLVLAPAACVLAGVSLSECLKILCNSVCSEISHELKKQGSEKKKSNQDEKKTMASKRESQSQSKSHKKRMPGKSGKTYTIVKDAAFISIMTIFCILSLYTLHSTWVSNEMYSAPSIVLQNRNKDGSIHVFDDFRESYSWLRHNTDPESKIASWWDYGYQCTAMANRTVLVDNNTWNTTHIATIGKALASPELKAWYILRSLDVNYVFVIFGGWIGYPSDDINKFLWMVRIASGVFPEIQESDYLNSNGGYTTDETMGKALSESIMYKLSYYNFYEGSKISSKRAGFDRVRNNIIGKGEIKLKYFEEVYTSTHWMVRIYKVKDIPKKDLKRKNPRKKITN